MSAHGSTAAAIEKDRGVTAAALAKDREAMFPEREPVVKGQPVPEPTPGSWNDPLPSRDDGTIPKGFDPYNMTGTGPNDMRTMDDRIKSKTWRTACTIS